VSVRPILRWPHPVLATVAEPVANPAAVADLVPALFDTMYAAQGRGLAAPQVGESLRVFVMDAGWKTGDWTPVACINPEIAPEGSGLTGEEACLSMPGVAVAVTRPQAVTLRYTAPDGTRHSLYLTGAAARIAQHELDHLDGLMHLDRLSTEDCTAAIVAYRSLT
jgi:peptide deformylase